MSEFGMGPAFGFNLATGAVALIVVCLVFAVLSWLDVYLPRRRSEKARLADEARLYAERRKLLDALNSVERHR